MLALPIPCDLLLLIPYGIALPLAIRYWNSRQQELRSGEMEGSALRTGKYCGNSGCGTGRPAASGAEQFYSWPPVPSRGILASMAAKVQCDASTMFSPEMFRKFVVPFLREQCAYLDHSMYHLDGNEQFRHLDALLEIEEIDAIEWTPNANLPWGEDPQWYDLCRRILDAGKSVQAFLVWPQEIVPLLDAVGGRGFYILGLFRSQAEVEAVAQQIETYRWRGQTRLPVRSHPRGGKIDGHPGKPGPRTEPV